MENTSDSLPYEFDDYTQRVIVASMITVISLTGIIGNVMVGVAVLLSTKLRTTTNVFVVNLSIADLLTCLVIPLDVTGLLAETTLPVANPACKIVTVIMFTTVGCSIYTLASIAVNRVFLITRPNTTYLRIFTPKKIAVWIVLTWLIPHLISLIPLLFQIGAVGFNNQYHLCGSLRSNPHYFTYNLITSLALYPVSLTTIFVSYPLIWIHLRRQAKRLVRLPLSQNNIFALSNPVMNQPQIKNNTCDIPDTTSSIEQNQIATTFHRESVSSGSTWHREVTKNMLYVVCGFGLCATPYALNIVIASDGPGIPYTVTILLLNSCINPIIYATKHRGFRTVFACILHRRWNQIPKPSRFLKALTR